jgi:hypothetical protein
MNTHLLVQLFNVNCSQYEGRGHHFAREVQVTVLPTEIAASDDALKVLSEENRY